MILHHNAVENHSHISWDRHLSVRSEMRCGKNNVVSLPFAGRKAGVGERWMLAIKSADRTIGIGLVGVAIKHLDFISVHEEHSAVAAPLSAAAPRNRLTKFQV